MRTFVFLAMLAVMVRLPAQDKPKDDKGNPFGVPIDTKAGIDEKALDPSLTDDERTWIKKYIRACKDGDSSSFYKERADVMEKIQKRFNSGVKNWTEADAQSREKTLEDLSTLENSQPAHLNPFIFRDTPDGYSVLIDYIANHNDNPDDLVKRMNMFGKVGLSWRAVVSKFLDNDKFKKATALERYQFVANWLMPKLTTITVNKYTLNDLIKDLKDDAGIVDKPDDKNAKAKRH